MNRIFEYALYPITLPLCAVGIVLTQGIVRVFNFYEHIRKRINHLPENKATRYIYCIEPDASAIMPDTSIDTRFLENHTASLESCIAKRINLI